MVITDDHDIIAFVLYWLLFLFCILDEIIVKGGEIYKMHAS